MELGGYGGAQLVVHRPGQEEVHAFPDGGQVKVGDAHGFGIAAGGVFDVHGHKVHQTFFHKGTQKGGEAAVGIQLDRETQFLDAAQEVSDVLLEQRLAAGDTHALQNALPLLQEGEKVLHIHQSGLAFGQHQFAVVAEGAAQIAPGGEYRTGHMTGEIQQSEFLQTGQFHNKRPLNYNR